LSAVAAPKGFSSDYVRWDGNVGSPISYKNAAGAWISGGAPENSEQAGYVQKAFSENPQALEIFQRAATDPGSLGNEAKAFMANPLFGLDSLGQAYRWGGYGNNTDLFDNSFNAHQVALLNNLGLSSYLKSATPAELAAGNNFLANENPAAQSARDDPDEGLGTFGTLAMIALAVYTGGAAIGAWGGAGVAGTVGAGAAWMPSLAAGAEFAVAGISAAEAAALSYAGFTAAEIGVLGAGVAAIAGGAAAGSELYGLEIGGEGVGAAVNTSGITGNAAIDKFISSIPERTLRNTVAEAITTGKVDPEKLVLGTVSGGINAYGNSLISDLGWDPAITRGLTAAVVGTGMGLAQGADLGDALTGGLISGVATGAGTAAANAVRDAAVDAELERAAAEGTQDYSDVNEVDRIESEVLGTPAEDSVDVTVTDVADTGDSGLIDVTVTDGGPSVEPPNIVDTGDTGEDFTVTDVADTETDVVTADVVADAGTTATNTGTTATDTGTGSSFSDILTPNELGNIAGTVAGTVTGDVISGMLSGTTDTDTVTGGADEEATGLMAAGVTMRDPSLQNYTGGKRNTNWNERRLP
jgi:hypothetical protein